MSLSALIWDPGTAQDAVTASFVKSQFLAAGIPLVDVETFSVLLSYPQGSVNSESGAIVSMQPGPSDPNNAQCSFVAGLQEVSSTLLLFIAYREKVYAQAPISSDPMSSNPNASYPNHGYGVTGDVTSSVVYVNYGTEADFEAVMSHISLPSATNVIRCVVQVYS